MARTLPPALIRTFTRVVLIVLILVFSGGVYMFLSATAGEVEKVDEDRALARVPVFEATKVEIQRQWTGQGVAEAMDNADVPARVSATIDVIEPCVLVGTRVDKGQLLFKLDPSDYERQVAQQKNTVTSIEAEIQLLNVERDRLAERLELAKEEAELAEDEFERVSKLFTSNAAGQQDKDRTRRQSLAAAQTVVQIREQLEKIPGRQAQLQARRDAQEAQLKLSQLNLERTQVTSPIDGVIAAVDVEVGENVTPGMRLTRVVNLQSIEVGLNLPSAARQSVAVGNQVTLTSVSDMARKWHGVIQRVSPDDDETNRTMKVFVLVDQSEAIQQYISGDASAKLRAQIMTPGTFLAGIVTSSIREARFVVPARAIRAGKVHVITDGMIETRNVKPIYNIEQSIDSLGLPDRQWVVLEDEGLKPGQMIAVNMSTTVLDGEQVDAVLPDGSMRPARPAKADKPSESDAAVEVNSGASS